MQVSGHPNFRPRFRFFTWHTALIGGVIWCAESLPLYMALYMAARPCTWLPSMPYVDATATGVRLCVGLSLRPSAITMVYLDWLYTLIATAFITALVYLISWGASKASEAHQSSWYNPRDTAAVVYNVIRAINAHASLVGD